jgi:uncharacterized protein VirK/YbjX
MLSHIWSRLTSSSVTRTAAAGLSLVRHAHLLAPILLARPGSRLNRYWRARPEILEMVYGPYMAANWDASTKIRRVLDHNDTVAKIGGILDTPPDEVADLIELKSIGPTYRITLDQARWLLREGQLALSLWDGVDRIFSLSFSLSTQDGQRIAFVGGIQGRRQVADEIDILERYRIFTKAAFGVRPRDFVVEVFRLLCQQINVTKILAVADNNHPTGTLQDNIKLPYDEIWRERRGVDNGNGFFLLPLNQEQRREEDIPAKKRSMYRKRFAMFSEIKTQLADSLRGERSPARAGAASSDTAAFAPAESNNFDRVLRALAYTGAILVLTVTKLFGGSWSGFAIGLCFVQLTYWLFRGNLSPSFARHMVALRRVRDWPLPVRQMLAACLIGTAVAIDVYLGGFRLGRAFNVYLLPLFVTSVFLGRGVALTVWLGCLSALYYLDLPPRFSFELEAIENLAELLVFTVLAGIVYAVPKLLETSIDLSLANQPRRRAT